MFGEELLIHRHVERLEVSFLAILLLLGLIICLIMFFFYHSLSSSLSGLSFALFMNIMAIGDFA